LEDLVDKFLLTEFHDADGVDVTILRRYGKPPFRE
jgi:hypothetical protein